MFDGASLSLSLNMSGSDECTYVFEMESSGSGWKTIKGRKYPDELLIATCDETVICRDGTTKPNKGEAIAAEDFPTLSACADCVA